VKWARSILRSSLILGLGEGTSRIAMFAVVAYISRKYGMQLFGAVALAQTVALYATQGTDVGFRLIGARLIARSPASAPIVVSILLGKRSITGCLAIAAALLYAFLAPMEGYARLCVAGFAIGLVPYLFSLDWLAWGLNRFGWLSAWKAGVTITFALASFVGFRLLSDARVSLVVANFVSLSLGSLVLWIIWRDKWKPGIASSTGSEPLAEAQEALRWKVVLGLGVTVILTQAFHNADTLLLAAMKPLSEVGRYNSAYKLFLLICGVYYLITQSLYPQLSRARGDGSHRRRVWLGLCALTVAGTIAAILLSIFAHPILTIVYGSDLASVRLLRLLSMAIPMDFVATTLGMSFVSRGFDKHMVFSLSAAALSNIGLNLFLIPKMSAEGAAIATLGSYVVLNVCLIVGFMVLPVFAETASRPPENTA